MWLVGNEELEEPACITTGAVRADHVDGIDASGIVLGHGETELITQQPSHLSRPAIENHRETLGVASIETETDRFARSAERRVARQIRAEQRPQVLRDLGAVELLQLVLLLLGQLVRLVRIVVQFVFLGPIKVHEHRIAGKPRAVAGEEDDRDAALGQFRIVLDADAKDARLVVLFDGHVPLVRIDAVARVGQLAILQIVAFSQADAGRNRLPGASPDSHERLVRALDARVLRRAASDRLAVLLDAKLQQLEDRHGRGDLHIPGQFDHPPEVGGLVVTVVVRIGRAVMRVRNLAAGTIGRAVPQLAFEGQLLALGVHVGQSRLEDRQQRDRVGPVAFERILRAPGHAAAGKHHL